VLDVLLQVYAFAIDVGVKAIKTAKMPAIEIAITKVSFLVIHVTI
jgi:hypothetical protein